MKKEIVKVDAEYESALAALRESSPVEQFASKIMLPRISMKSQDETKETGTGKNKKIELVTAAGTFFTETQTEKEDPDTGRKIWDKKELGDSFDGIIIYQRKQLRMYDESTELYTSSPVYDSDDEIVPLFCNKVQVARGTPAELKAKYQTVDEKTKKPKSKLEDNKVLYVVRDDMDKPYQMSLRGSSMFSFMAYGRKTFVPSVVTKFSSEPMEKGNIAWNKMTFEVARKLSTDELREIAGKVDDIRGTIEAEKAQYGGSSSKGDAELKTFVEELKS